MSNRFSWKVDKYIKDNNPCRECKPPVRHGGCHSKGECEKYDKFREELDSLKEEVREEQTSAVRSLPTNLVERKRDEWKKNRRT